MKDSRTLPKVMPFDPEVLELGKPTMKQRVYYEAYGEKGTVAGVGRIPEFDVSVVSRAIRWLQSKALDAGWVPKGQVEADKRVVKKNLSLIDKKLKNKVSIYVITWAQNATPVHDGFLESLKTYCEHNGAVLLVIAGRYRNPTSQWTQAQQDHEYWVDEVAPYLIDARKDLNENLIIMGDIKTQPTAVSPLSGFETITTHKTGIFGHPKVELKSIATPQNDLPKLLVTTGSVTERNYTDTKAGQKSSFHHTFGATVIEIQGEAFHMRQINATEEGGFIDLETEYKPGKVSEAGRPLGLVLGDVHADFVDPVCEKITFFDKDGIINTLNPEKVVFHDWYDGYSGSHHHEGKIFTQYAKHHSRRNNVEYEINRTFEKTLEWVKPGIEYYIVDSNHNQHLVTWLEKCNPKIDPENAAFYHHVMSKMLPQTTMGEGGAEFPNPLQLLADEKLNLPNLHFLTSTDKLMIGDVDCSQHGNKGANGARGGVRPFSLIGVKTITGHGHGPHIMGGHYRVGTNSMLNLEYVEGLSSWLHTDCVIYANGKRSLIHKIDGCWRAKRRRKVA